MTEQDWEEEDEATAIVNLEELRTQTKNKKSRHHLLIHIQGTELGRVRPLTKMVHLIGRSTDADLCLNDDGVSRKHARFTKEGAAFFLADLKSANGTFVQGEKITRRKLLDGDQIQLGPTALFRYSVTDDDNRALLEQLYATSVSDALTGARNREFLDTLLLSELSYAKRHDQELSFVLFDLDHFKNVNDTHGHPAGDTVLIEIARAVMGQLRTEDSLCRYGGEEFCVLLRNVDLQGAHAMGERIRNVIEELTITHDELSMKVTASVGCATRSELEDPNPISLIALADKRLYAAKDSGRNTVISS